MESAIDPRFYKERFVGYVFEGEQRLIIVKEWYVMIEYPIVRKFLVTGITFLSFCSSLRILSLILH